MKYVIVASTHRGAGRGGGRHGGEGCAEGQVEGHVVLMGAQDAQEVQLSGR